MKTLLVFSLCIICVECKLEVEFAGASGPWVHSFFAAGTRHKRQVRDPREEMCSTEEFARRRSTVSCNPSIGQIIVDIYAECSTESEIRNIVQSCSWNENGRFCYELRQNASNYTNSVETNCQYQSNYSGYQCTDSCRDALQNLKSNIGCCHLSFSNRLNTGLWSACGVIHPNFCNDSTLTLGSVTDTGNCSDFSDLNKQLYRQFYCSGEVSHSFLDVYRQCGYQDYYDIFIDTCRVNEIDELCAVITIHPNVTLDLALQAVESDCLLNSTQGCTHSCQTALDYLKSTIGCCVTLYSTIFPNATNPVLWLACSIPFPAAELCPSTLLSSNQSSGPTASSSVTTSLTTSSYNSASTLHSPNIILLLIFSALFTMYNWNCNLHMEAWTTMHAYILMTVVVWTYVSMLFNYWLLS